MKKMINVSLLLLAICVSNLYATSPLFSEESVLDSDQLAACKKCGCLKKPTNCLICPKGDRRSTGPAEVFNGTNPGLASSFNTFGQFILGNFYVDFANPHFTPQGISHPTPTTFIVLQDGIYLIAWGLNGAINTFPKPGHRILTAALFVNDMQIDGTETNEEIGFLGAQTTTFNLQGTSLLSLSANDTVTLQAQPDFLDGDTAAITTCRISFAQMLPVLLTP